MYIPMKTQILGAWIGVAILLVLIALMKSRYATHPITKLATSGVITLFLSWMAFGVLAIMTGIAPFSF